MGLTGSGSKSLKMDAISGKSLMGKAQIHKSELLFLPTRRILGMLGAEVERK
jgi:hypothetical protein